MFLDCPQSATLPAALIVYTLSYFPAGAQGHIDSSHSILAFWAARAVEASKVKSKVRSLYIRVLYQTAVAKEKMFLVYRVHDYGNTHFIIVLDKKKSNLKISWIY